ncbi:hypothetical protein QJ850_gp382 [Acanthamoeba polyphaga mimivirus]|uniref:Uncharacterized protein n=1 Tax=Acanthamoeba polyphaga mimivirus Kroon TaxID=3069720 RepID=A0A0G2Y8Z6_9VIRU|nr:hypothetical protein QJ850_gp382 [Acanthamoeba polyphaga mimivirus]AKI80317.1 hypothetical protein [Acanthamoeba polyphaga mimivirus Kroon]
MTQIIDRFVCLFPSFRNKDANYDLISQDTDNSKSSLNDTSDSGTNKVHQWLDTSKGSITVEMNLLVLPGQPNIKTTVGHDGWPEGPKINITFHERIIPLAKMKADPKDPGTFEVYIKGKNRLYNRKIFLEMAKSAMKHYTAAYDGGFISLKDYVAVKSYIQAGIDNEELMRQVILSLANHKLETKFPDSSDW